jgi:hypothetical protein
MEASGRGRLLGDDSSCSFFGWYPHLLLIAGENIMPSFVIDRDDKSIRRNHREDDTKKEGK